tara:strand:+ start:1192 stop:1701 length:510 start_codon:yes stop_codon:yes gene_type:complete
MHRSGGGQRFLENKANSRHPVMAVVPRLRYWTPQHRSMITFLLGMITDIVSGAAATRIRASEAFETPPRNTTARRWAAFALNLFLLTSSLMLGAALVDWFTGRRFLAECLGWTGVACLQLCVVCGVRYAIVNQNVNPATNLDSESGEPSRAPEPGLQDFTNGQSTFPAR